VNEPGHAVDEVVPWHIRAVRRVRTSLVGIRSWMFGWGIGGVLFAGLVVIVVGYFALGTFGADHVPRTPCHQAQSLVDQLDTVQRDEHGMPLDRSSVQELHRIGSRLAPIADDAYGSLADNLHTLSTTATDAQVGGHLRARITLSQEFETCHG
jgi:hypothetical protein